MREATIMSTQSLSFGRTRALLVAASGAAAIAAAGCGEISDDGTTTTQSEIIGGSAPLTTFAIRQLGLVQFGCSSALFNKDWVLTASHCINWGNIPAMQFSIPRTDSGVDTRPGVYAVQAGATDITMVKLGPGLPGNMWPNVSHPITTQTSSSFVGGPITCYGAGANAYDPDGAGVIGGGIYMSITKTVLDMTTDIFNSDIFRVSSPSGQNVLSWGDSGSNCFTSNGQVLATHSAGNCSNWQGMGQPGVHCDPTNVIAQLDNFLSSTSKWRAYLTEAPNRAGTTFELMTPLLNGWTAAAFGANYPGATKVGGIVTLRGAIANGTAQQPFTLPSKYWPSGRVYVPVATTNNSIGRLVIETNGVVNIECEGGGGFCQNSAFFTSLDGVSYAQDSGSSTALTLQNGWTTAPFGNRAPAVKIVNGQVHFIGAMSTSGTNTLAFRLPLGFRPTVAEWLPIGLCNSAKGRLNIATNGDTTIQVESGGSWSSAQCFTSLEGASFSLNASSGTLMTLQNGWVGGSFGAGQVRVSNDNGVIRFRGAVSGGTATKIMTLPAQFRPATNVWLYADSFAAKRNRLLVTPDGSVSVDPAGLLADAQSFLSLEGAEFGI
jgi:hypothetical protein